jgi:prolyl 4-hydroxylase
MWFDMASSGAANTAARLATMAGVRRVPHRALQQFMLPRFLSADECAALVAMIETEHVPSTITDDIGDAAFRTSSTCNLDHRIPMVADIDDRLCALAGIPPSHGEPLQGQRYDVGQEFKAHTDYFEPTGVDFEEHTSVSGQRTWTMMAYLNDVPAGGGTRFLTPGKIHQPETGKLLMWCNLTPDGAVNPATLHHGMKVRQGRKYIITKWFRERAWPWG